ncbi:unnamed protein product, partial [Sphacelaria rigidula]
SSLYPGRRSTPLGIYVGAPAGVTQEEGQHTSCFFSLFVLVLRLPSAVVASILYRERGSVVPFPRRLLSRNLYIHDMVALFCWALCEKTVQIFPRLEPTTQPSEGVEITNCMSHRGDRLRVYKMFSTWTVPTRPYAPSRTLACSSMLTIDYPGTLILL